MTTAKEQLQLLQLIQQQDENLKTITDLKDGLLIIAENQHARIEALEAALEFYADGCKRIIEPDNRSHCVAPDAGETARRALEGDSQ